jgi:hypothetical protein
MYSADKPSHSQYLLKLLVVLTINITLAVATIIYNNSLRSAPIFLFLLASGVAVMAALGLTRGGIFGLFMVSISIAAKQFIGAWSKDNLTFNLLETFLMAGVFGLSGHYHDTLRKYFDAYNDAKQRLNVFDLEDTSVGLIRPAIGLLRLKEETDRAARYKRPLSFALILALPKPGLEWDLNERLSVRRAIATTVKDTTRVLDIPFSFNDEKIALILTDTEINGTNKVINNIQRQLNASRIITRTGSSESLQEHAQIRFGYSVFLGYSSKAFDMMEAAELSLKRNIEMNAGGIFQNLFIDWEPVGEPPAFNTILAANTKGILDAADMNIPVIENNQK